MNQENNNLPKTVIKVDDPKLQKEVNIWSTLYLTFDNSDPKICKKMWDLAHTRSLPTAKDLHNYNASIIAAAYKRLAETRYGAVFACGSCKRVTRKDLETMIPDAPQYLKDYNVLHEKNPIKRSNTPELDALMQGGKKVPLEDLIKAAKVGTANGDTDNEPGEIECPQHTLEKSKCDDEEH